MVLIHENIFIYQGEITRRMRKALAINATANANANTNTKTNTNVNVIFSFKPIHPIVLVLPSKDSTELNLKESVAALQILLAMHLSKSEYDVTCIEECTMFYFNIFKLYLLIFLNFFIL